MAPSLQALSGAVSLTLSLLLTGAVTITAAASSPRVAIIGAGVGGASAAYFLRTDEALKGLGLTIDVFESADDVGGRVKEFDFQGVALELGASILWSKNYYVVNTSRALGLSFTGDQEEDQDAPGFSIFDGKKIVFSQAPGWPSFLKAALRYGSAALLYSRHVANVWTQRFAQIYELQAANVTFDTPDELLKAVQLWEFTQVTCEQHIKDYLRSQWLVWGASAFARELAGCINRCNYNQRNAQMNALAGLISFIPATSDGDVLSIQGGNALLVQAMMAAAKVMLVQQRVAAIAREPDGRLSLTTTEPGAAPLGPYDAVIVAAPLEAAEVDLSGVPGAASALGPPREFQITISTYVRGQLEPAYFNVPSMPTRTVLVTDDADVPFTAIGSRTANGTRVFKLFSERPIPLETLTRVFQRGYEILRTQAWAAYPRFSPPERFSAFVLAPGLFYNNAIENAASAMEMSALAAKNSALLARKHILAQAAAAGPASTEAQAGAPDAVAAAQHDAGGKVHSSNGSAAGGETADDRDDAACRLGTANGGLHRDGAEPNAAAAA